MRTMPRLTVAFTLAVMTMLAGCGGDAPKPARIIETPQEAVSRSGDVTVRANVVRTDLLNETMARGYGIARDEGTVLLMVSVRRGPDGQDMSIPAKVQATVTDLQGRRRTLALRELRTEVPGAPPEQAMIDHIGTTGVAAPDTLRFDLAIEREGGARSTMQFTREFSAR
ncbi:MAG: DUF4426 domain-containing protein [Lysobacter sp.]|nr:DUF4426 domain-containing protein [Lysobacter sp.]